jgi:hypothetical protein
VTRAGAAAAALAAALLAAPAGAAGSEREGLEVLVAGIETVTELRLMTGERRTLPGGGSEPVYRTHRPAEGRVFVTTRFYVANDGPSFYVRGRDLAVVDEEGNAYAPLDWFFEVGLEEARGESLLVAARALINFTAEVPQPAAGSVTLRFTPGPAVASAVPGDPGGEDEPVAEGADLIVAGTRMLSELRIQTETTRVNPEGRTEPVYTLRKPGPGRVFVNARVYVIAGDEPLTVAAGDLRIGVRVEGGPPAWSAFDAFREKGLEEDRLPVYELTGKNILNFTVEMPGSELADAEVFVAGRSAGRVRISSTGP